MVVFIDEGMGRYIVPEALRGAGLSVEVHLDHFRQGTPDREWIEEVSKRGWAIIGKDKGHRYESLEMLAIERSKARLFTLGSGMSKGRENADVILKAWPAMQRFDATHAAPYIARIARDGRVEAI